MSAAASDRNLLFGILALQVNFINRDALIRGMNAWVLEKHRTLADILSEQGAIKAENRALLEPLVEQHLKEHGNDPQQSLVAISSVGSVRDDLQQIADPELCASLAHVSARREENAPATRPPAQGENDQAEVPATRPTSVGVPTSSGLRFRILRPHARGGLGEVFVARDEELHREVALKEIQGRHADHPDSRTRFVLEAEITGRLEHPGIVPVYGLGHYADGRPFYAMRFIRGDSLQQAIEAFHKADVPGRDLGERTLSLRGLLGRFVDVCQAIAYAHSRGVLHRDLKPGNIMLGQYGETLVVDWGLAKASSGTDSETVSAEGMLRPPSASGSAPTQMGSAIGTPPFMSPEQAVGRLDLLGPTSDVYSLGATLYCLLTGQPPFPAPGEDGLGALLHKVEQGDFVPPRKVKADVPRALEAICLKAMARKQEERYASVVDLSRDVTQWLADEPVSVYRESVLRSIVRWCNRKPGMAVFASSYLVMATIDLLFGLLLLPRQSESAFQVILAVVFGPPLFAFIAMSFGNVFAILNAPIAILLRDQPLLQRMKHLGVRSVTTGTFIGGIIVLVLACTTLVALWAPRGPTAGGLKNYDRLPDLRLVASTGAGIGLAIGFTCSLAFRLTRVWAIVCTCGTIVACSIASATTFTLLLLPIRLN
jgi:serine/threonine-protein kinase